MPIKYITLGKDELLLLLLGLDNYSPIKGVLRLQFMCFLYHYFGFKFTFGPCGPYSIELMETLERLIREGFVRVYISLDSEGNLVKAFSLTEKGRIKAAYLIDYVRRNNVLLEGVAIRPGSDVISELEAIKRTYNDKSLSFMLMKVLRLIKDEWPYWIECDERLKQYASDIIEEITPYLYGRS